MEARPSEETIERARQAIMNAPKTESGLVLPPHVAAARAAEVRIDEAAAPTLNRAQRRDREKRQRRLDKKLRHASPETRQAHIEARAHIESMSEQELREAEVRLTAIAGMTDDQRAELAAELERELGVAP